MVAGPRVVATALVRVGAFLVRDAGDVLRELPEEDRRTLTLTGARRADALPEDAAVLLAALSDDEPRDADALADATRLGAARLSGALVALDLEGRVETLPAPRFLRRRP